MHHSIDELTPEMEAREQAAEFQAAEDDMTDAEAEAAQAKFSAYVATLADLPDNWLTIDLATYP